MPKDNLEQYSQLHLIALLIGKPNSFVFWIDKLKSMKIQNSLNSRLILLVAISLFNIKYVVSQTYNCYSLVSMERKYNLKQSLCNVNINTSIKEIEVSKFFNGGTEPLNMKIDSIAQKEYNSEMCDWYYCHSDRKDILIVPVSNSKKKIYLFDFADEVTIFEYTFTYK